MLGYLSSLITGLWAEFTAFFAASYTHADLLDMLVVAGVIYGVLMLIRGTRAVQVLGGLAALLGVRLLAGWLGFDTLIWLFDNLLGSLVLIIVILFADDIRRALARLGRRFVPRLTEWQDTRILEEVVRATQELSRRRNGALVLFERESRLADQLESAAPVDAAISKDLLVCLFQPTSPLHDGGVVIRSGRISLARAILPLTLRDDLPEDLGTRHRAAIGLTEQTDAVVVVISEETGAISVAMGGELTRGLGAPELSGVLREFLSRDPQEDEREPGEEEDELLVEEDPAQRSGRSGAAEAAS